MVRNITLNINYYFQHLDDHYDDSKLGLDVYKSHHGGGGVVPGSEDHHLVLPVASPLPQSVASAKSSLQQLYAQQTQQSPSSADMDKYHQHLQVIIIFFIRNWLIWENY